MHFSKRDFALDLVSYTQSAISQQRLLDLECFYLPAFCCFQAMFELGFQGGFFTRVIICGGGGLFFGIRGTA